MFDCTSYPASNLGEFSGFLHDAATRAGAAIPDWQAQGFSDKGAWKRARAAAGLDTSGGINTLPGPSSGGGSTPGGATDQVTDKVPGQGQPGSSGGGLLGGIPTKYLLIGGVIAALMVMKK
jgi:hypothetical protein